MPKNPFPYYGWFARDWLASEARATMTLEQQGAYRNLLDHAWLNDPPCTLPTDHRVLAMFSGLGDRWPEVGVPLLEWFVEKQGRLVNERLQKVFKEAMRQLRQKKEAGKKGGLKSAEERAKRGKQRSSDAQAPQVAEGKHAMAMAKASLAKSTLGSSAVTAARETVSTVLGQCQGVSPQGPEEAKAKATAVLDACRRVGIVIPNGDGSWLGPFTEALERHTLGEWLDLIERALPKQRNPETGGPVELAYLVAADIRNPAHRAQFAEERWARCTTGFYEPADRRSGGRR